MKTYPDHNKMNRLSVYSYLTWYTHGHSGSGGLFTEPLPELDHDSIQPLNYHQNWPTRSCELAWTNPAGDQPPTTGFTGSDAGSERAESDNNIYVAT